MNGSEFLSELVLQKTYAATKMDGGKETWVDVVARVFGMHRRKFRSVKDPAFWEVMDMTEKLVLDRVVLGSQRNLQYAGTPVEKDNLRSYNCSAISPKQPEDFAEIMLLSMLGVGTGAGFPESISWGISQNTSVFVVEDTRESWVASVAHLLRNPDALFDTSRVRPKGAPLSTGGYASGPESLELGHAKIRKVLKEDCAAIDNIITVSPYAGADIVAIILELVVAGSSRRSAGIALFKDASRYKTRESLEIKPYRHFLNVSEYKREDNPEHTREIVLRALRSGTGEPGHVKYFVGTRFIVQACGELTLREDGGLCNLTTINCVDAVKKDCVWDAIVGAVFLGTLQAAYTDFPSISTRWAEHAKEDALLGVSITGVQQVFEQWCDALMNPPRKEDLQSVLKGTNELTAAWIGIKPAKRITCGKPEGNTSALLGTLSGAHTVVKPYAIRTVRLEKVHPIYKHMLSNPRYAKWVEDCAYRGETTAVVNIPCHWAGAPELTPEQLVHRVRKLYELWVLPGHVSDEPYTNSISLTVEMGEEDLTEQMIEDFKVLGNFTVLPKNDVTYKQMPFGWISKEEYETKAKEFAADMADFDFSCVRYVDFREDTVRESACSAGGCTFGA